MCSWRASGLSNDSHSETPGGCPAKARSHHLQATGSQRYETGEPETGRQSFLCLCECFRPAFALPEPDYLEDGLELVRFQLSGSLFPEENCWKGLLGCLASNERCVEVQRGLRTVSGCEDWIAPPRVD